MEGRGEKNGESERVVCVREAPPVDFIVQRPSYGVDYLLFVITANDVLCNATRETGERNGKEKGAHQRKESQATYRCFRSFRPATASTPLAEEPPW